MRTLALAISLTTATTPVLAQGDDEIVFITSIVIHADGLSSQDLERARVFARCLSWPNFPAGKELDNKLSACRAQLPENQSEKLASVVGNIEVTVREYPGSEATLTVAEKVDDVRVTDGAIAQ